VEPALLLAAAPDAPGARALVERALAAGAGAHPVLLTGEGLAWSRDEGLAQRVHRGEARLSICSASARDHGETPHSVPPHVRWSSLVVWLSDLPKGTPLWTAFP
jgi:hypothetical protein